MSKSVTESNMSAASRQNYVQQMYGENLQQVPPNQREDMFFTSQNNYFEWLRVWKMIVSENKTTIKICKRNFYTIDKK